MIGSDLIKFESWIKCADSTVPLIGRKCTHTHANSCISSSIYNLFHITSSYLHVGVSKKRAAVLKLFNRSHKSKKKTRRNSAAPPPHCELFTQRISGLSDSRFLCCHLAEIEDVITPRKVTLFKYKSWTEQQIRRRQNVVISRTFSFRGRTQINSKRGVGTNYIRRNDQQPPTSTSKNSTTTSKTSTTMHPRTIEYHLKQAII